MEFVAKRKRNNPGFSRQAPKFPEREEVTTGPQLVHRILLSSQLLGEVLFWPLIGLGMGQAVGWSNRLWWPRGRDVQPDSNP